MTKLRLAFMGTPDFAVPTLQALRAAGHEIAAVYCQPPRPAGRGNRLQPSAAQKTAEAAGIPVRAPERFDAEAVAGFAALELDAAVVAAYGLLLPRTALAAPRLGCINVHASLLPRWRGAAPIQRAILAGDAASGVTIMQMDAGLDTGPMLLQSAVPITPATTGQTLHDALAGLGTSLVLEALDGLAEGTLRPQPQPEGGVIYAKKLRREEGLIDWKRSAVELERAVRAFNPWPGSWFEFGGERIKILAAETAPGRPGAGPGVVFDDRLTVQCGEGAMRPVLLQRAGRAALPLDAFLRGHSIPRGTELALL